MPQPSITKMCLKITRLKFHSNFPGAKELSKKIVFIILVYMCIGYQQKWYDYQHIAWAGIILWMLPANERWRYIVMSPLIGWAHTQNDPSMSEKIFNNIREFQHMKPINIFGPEINDQCFVDDILKRLQNSQDQWTHMALLSHNGLMVIKVIIYIFVSYHLIRNESRSISQLPGSLCVTAYNSLSHINFQEYRDGFVI